MFEDDTNKPPTSKEEADDARPRPPPEKYDPDNRSHWSITETLAWIIWRDLDAVRNELDDYRNDCADKPSGWNELRLRARLKNLSPQVAIKELWFEAGERRIKATALQCENAKAFLGNHVEIPADHWSRLKHIDDPSSGKAVLFDDQGRVYREVEFRRLDVKELWPKSPPLSEEHAETWPSHLALIQLTESTMWSGLFSPPCAYSDSHRSEGDALEHAEKPEPEQTRSVEPELLEPKKVPEDWLVWAIKKYPKQRNERPTSYICHLHGLMEKADNVTYAWKYETFRIRYYEAVKAERQAVQKKRKSPRTV
jgi:hypothetical protein